MENVGPYRDPAGVVFFIKPSNFRVEAHMEAFAEVALTSWSVSLTSVCLACTPT
jgi:hypothetical protein